MGGDGIEDVVVACNSSKKIRNNSSVGIAFGAPGGIICAKASMLLQVRVITMLRVTSSMCIAFIFRNKKENDKWIAEAWLC
jgi:hypothetical protein